MAKKYKKGASLDIYAPEGTKVMGMFKDGELMHGYEFQKEQAMNYIKEGEVYTVDHTDVDKWNTDVYLREFPGISFNSVHFIHA